MKLFAALLPLISLSACSDPGDGRVPELPTEPYVAATFFPLADFARRLVGPDVEVRCPLPAGEDPIFWQPDRRALATFRGAALIASNGAVFEKWIPLASLPESRHVRTADAFPDEWLEFEETTHSHGPGQHTHAGIDGHTWVDPVNAARQARTLALGLELAFPERAGEIRERLGVLVAELDALHERCTALTPRLTGVRLIASHPAYDYLAARHGWTLENLDLDPQGGVAQLDDLDLGPDATPGLCLWENEPSAALAVALSDRFDVTSLLFTPAENPPAADAALGYVALQEANLQRLEDGLTALGR